MDAEGPSPGLQDTRDAAQQLVDARKNGRPLGAIPAGLALRSVAQAYAIQDEIIAHWAKSAAGRLLRVRMVASSCVRQFQNPSSSNSRSG